MAFFTALRKKEANLGKRSFLFDRKDIAKSSRTLILINNCL